MAGSLKDRFRELEEKIRDPHSRLHVEGLLVSFWLKAGSLPAWVETAAWWAEI